MQGVLAGRYRLERQLGKGGMGSVWLAEHLALRSWVAVKLMDPAIAATPEGAERFRREAQAAASLRSAHVVQVLDYGVHETTPYLVMELLHGESLAGCLEREKRLTPARAVAVVTQVARALGRAHSAGIVHRDLKPDNVYLVREDDQELVKILDFGIAKTPQAHFGGMETRTGVTMGTPYYMSPEQVEGKKAVDFRTDLWAMAVITCECLTGVRPFDGSTYGELLLNICARPIPPPSSQGLQLPGFDAWFAKATSRDPEQRFTSAQELAATLKDVVEGNPHGFVQAPPAYAPAATGAALASPSASSIASVSSMNTSQPLEPLPLRKVGALPWILLGVVLLIGAVSATVFVMRPRGNQVGAETPSAVPPLPSHAPSVVATTSADAVPVTSAPAPAAPRAVSRPSAAGKPAVSREAPASALATPPASKALRCFSDPFSGQVRPAGANQPAGAATFGCTQDPFTGKYKKL